MNKIFVLDKILLVLDKFDFIPDKNDFICTDGQGISHSIVESFELKKVGKSGLVLTKHVKI